MKTGVAFGTGVLAGTLGAALLIAMHSSSREPGDRPFRLMSAKTFLLDAALRSWSPAASLQAVREDHETLLLGNGKVLVLGGTDASSRIVTGAELFDPASGSFGPAGSRVGAGGRIHPLPRPDGGVLVLEGRSSDLPGVLASWSGRDAWGSVPLPEEQAFQGALELPEGRVLLVDRERSWTGDGRGAWEAAGTLHFNSTLRSLLPLPEGALLLPWDVPEKKEDPKDDWYPSHLVWNARTRAWSEYPALAAALRGLGPNPVPLVRAFALSDGRVAILGGGSGLLWDSVHQNAVPLPTLPTSSTSDLSIARLPDDRLILGGGHAGGSAETFLLDLSKGAWVPGPALPEERSRFCLTPLADGRVLLSGGGSLGYRPTGAGSLAVFLGILAAVVILGAAGLVARAGGPGRRWAGFAAGLAIPALVAWAGYWFLAIVASGIRG